MVLIFYAVNIGSYPIANWLFHYFVDYSDANPGLEALWAEERARRAEQNIKFSSITEMPKPDYLLPLSSTSVSSHRGFIIIIIFFWGGVIVVCPKLVAEYPLYVVLCADLLHFSLLVDRSIGAFSLVLVIIQVDILSSF